jgi:cyclophilin family peptidyl-prolyl cis-trans isomerase
MKKYGCLLSLFFIVFSCAKPLTKKVCVLQTSMGTMVFRFFEEDAPNTSLHFQKLVNEGFYDGRFFYRVVKGHVIQSGDGGDNRIPAVKAEFNKNSHIRGAVGLARGDDPDSGSTEFYICLTSRPHLDGKYTVFGQVIEGLDVLEKIGNVDVTAITSNSASQETHCAGVQRRELPCQRCNESRRQARNPFAAGTRRNRGSNRAGIPTV